MEVYRARVIEWKKANPWCQACPKLRPRKKILRTTSCHHIRGRVGRLLLDERWWLPVCNVCHREIHLWPAIARGLDLLAGAGKWNVFEP